MRDVFVNNYRLKKAVDLRFIGLIFFSLLYAIYIYVQNTDIFFESQFLHIPFLEDLSRNDLTVRGFFTVYGEHLFPGYNIILAINYYLFAIWGGFDAVVHAVAVMFTAAVVVYGIKREYFSNFTSYAIAIIFSSSLLLSTTKNPQWGMALAAAIGVAISSVFVARYSKLVLGGIKKLSTLELSLVPLAIIFFLGGYSLGLIAAVGAVTFYGLIHKTTNIRRILIPILTLIISVAIYCILVIKFSALFKNSPTSGSFDLIECIKFLLVISASASLGRAFFENFHTLLPYYFFGLLLISWVAIFICKILKESRSNSLFFFGLLTYSLANIIIVSMFRYKNGTEGGMGQWYNVHTQFLTLVIVMLLLKEINFRLVNVREIIKISSVMIIIVFMFIGYCCDFVKAQYVKPWKQQFISQAFNLLVSPKDIKDKNNSMNTMLWEYESAKYGIEFLHAKSLWIFNKNEIYTAGVTPDNWVTADEPVTIMCPATNNVLTFNSWRPESQPKSTVLVRTQDQTYEMTIGAEIVSIGLGKSPFVQILAVEKTQFINSEKDKRNLIFIIDNLGCKTVQDLLEVISWGPTSSKVGVNPNPQADEGVGFWINAKFSRDQLQEGDIELHLGSYSAQNISVQNELITASFDASILKIPGSYELYLVGKSSLSRTSIGKFLVE